MDLLMKLRQLLLCSVISLLASQAALAAGPDALRYSYVDMALSAGEVDTFGGDVDFGAAGVTGSLAVHDNIALFGRVGATVVDTSDGFFDDLETTELSLGVNPHLALSRNVHLVFPVALEWAEVDDGIFEDDDWGYSIGVGVRALLNRSWELAGGVQHVDIFGGDDQSIGGSVRWHIGELFSLSLGATASDDAHSFSFGGRFSF
jgi:hypothetical protein